MTAEDPDAFAVAAARLVLNQDVWSRMSDEARRTAQSYESGRIAALAAEQYGFMIRQKKEINENGFPSPFIICKLKPKIPLVYNPPAPNIPQ